MTKSKNSNRLYSIFNTKVNIIIKTLIVLLFLFVAEYFIWTHLNYHHKPNELALGNSIAFLIFIGTSIMFVYLISKKNGKWAVLLVIHIIGLFFIDRVTLDHGNKRYLDSIQETWEFHQYEMKYMVKLDKEQGCLIIYRCSILYPDRELCDPILNGRSIEIENGWQMVTDSTCLIIQDNKLIGFPTEIDTQVLRKIYF